MNRRQRMEEAAQWVLLRRDGERFDEKKRQEFNEWLQRSIRNIAAYIAAERMYAKIVRRSLAQRTRRLQQTATPVGEAAPRRAVMSRRRMIKTLAAGVSGLGITAALTSVIETRRQDLIASEHVRQVRLNGGIMHAARNASLSIDRRSAPQVVHLLAGQVALHLWQTLETGVRVITSLGEIAADAASVGIVLRESMLAVSVAEGSVRVTAPGTDLPEMVSAGQKLILRSGVAGVERLALDHPEQEIAWTTQGDLYFRGEPFSEAAAAFNGFNELQIVPSSEVASLIVGTQQYALNDPEAFVRRIAFDWQLDTRRDGKRIHVFKREGVPGER